MPKRISMFAGCTAFAEVLEMDASKKYMALFSVLFRCSEALKIQVQDEMVRIAEEMNDDDLHSIFTTELFNEMDKMIEEKKYSLENACLLLIQVKFNFMLNEEFDERFVHSYLNKRLEMMIEEENNKTEGNNKKQLILACECYFMMNNNDDSKGLYTMGESHLLRAALNQVESEETRTEVEMALMALCHVSRRMNAEKELAFNGVKGIIKNYQMHHNLTRQAYQSAWEFLMFRFDEREKLTDAIVNELHFAREAAREMEDLLKCADWKGKIEKNREKGGNALQILLSWLQIISIYFCIFKHHYEVHAGLMTSIVGVFRAAKGNNREIGMQCLDTINCALKFTDAEPDDLLSEGAVDLVLEETAQSNDGRLLIPCLKFFKCVCERLKSQRNTKNEEVKRKKAKRKLFEKMEEEGYEDCIIGLLYFIEEGLIWNSFFIEKLEDYFIFF